MRNALSIPLHGTDCLIIASDNSGGIGLKKDDLVSVPYEMTAYYSFRVAAMECIAAGGEPFAVILGNFCGNEAWEELTRGIQRGLDELYLKNVAITGSTESNFSLQQSAIGITIIGKKTGGKIAKQCFTGGTKVAVIGKPLVGNEVIEQQKHVVPLSLFQKINRLEDVVVWPVGSKGILFELNQIFTNKKFLKDDLITEVEIDKSSGPATCIIAVFREDLEKEIKNVTGSYFHSIQITK